jgi:hypothetical protein
MKRTALILLFFLSLLSPVAAQITQTQTQAAINNQLTSCGNGCNTAATLRSLLDVLVTATFQSQGASGLSISGTPSSGFALIATGPTTATWGPVVLPTQNLTITGVWAFTTTPTVPTQTMGDSSTNAASTAFVQAAVSGPTSAVVQQAVAVTAPNTLAALSQSVTGTMFLLIVNGQTLVSVGGSPPFTVSGTTVTWSATNAGFALQTTDTVVAVYTH